MKFTHTDHAQAADAFIRDEERTNWHDGALWFVRQKRDRAVQQLPEWEQLREAASRIKDYVLAHLDELLVQFEEKATRNGVKIHWAADAQEHNQIVLKIIREERIGKVVKSKSMLTEECHLNEFLTENKVEVVDTDLY